MLDTRAERLAAGIAVLSGGVLAATLWFFMEGPLRTFAPLLGLGDALVTYLVMARSFAAEPGPVEEY